MREEVLAMGKRARRASLKMAIASSSVKRDVLESVARALEKERPAIATANEKDLLEAEKRGNWATCIA